MKLELPKVEECPEMRLNDTSIVKIKNVDPKLHAKYLCN